MTIRLEYGVDVLFSILSDITLFESILEHFSRPASALAGRRHYTGNTGNGTSNNTLAYADTQGNTFTRSVDAALNVVVRDVQGGLLAPGPALFPGLKLKASSGNGDGQGA
ncbi:hypothetical protein ACEPAG_4126 [Sanghuangporus baumii]